jgi:hypothetical protein
MHIGILECLNEAQSFIDTATDRHVIDGNLPQNSLVVDNEESAVRISVLLAVNSVSGNPKNSENEGEKGRPPRPVAPPFSLTVSTRPHSDQPEVDISADPLHPVYEAYSPFGNAQIYTSQIPRGKNVVQVKKRFRYPYQARWE